MKPWVALLAFSAWQYAPSPPTHWHQPFVVDARFWWQPPGQRRAQLVFPGQVLELEAGAEATLVLETLDQWGKPFPQEKAGFFLDHPEACDGILEARFITPGRLHLRAPLARGSCRLSLGLLGNLNLQWSFELQVTSLAKGGYTREQAEFIVTRLYRALFSREPDPQGFQAAVMEVQRNRLGFLLEGMLKSPEFKQKWAGLTPSAFLERVYHGLLQRPPDSAGVARYLRKVERGKLKEVLAEVIHSEEFEKAMAEAQRP